MNNMSLIRDYNKFKGEIVEYFKCNEPVYFNYLVSWPLFLPIQLPKQTNLLRKCTDYRRRDGETCHYCDSKLWFRINSPDGFYYNRYNSNQKTVQSLHFCASCGAFRGREWDDIERVKSRKDKRAKDFSRKPKGAVCCQCGSNDQVAADHIRPVELYILDAIRGVDSIENIMYECHSIEHNRQFLCKECHRIKTNEDRIWIKEYSMNGEKTNGY